MVVAASAAPQYRARKPNFSEPQKKNAPGLAKAIGASLGKPEHGDIR